VFGTLTLNNDLTLSGGTYYFDVATTNHDLLVVGGALNNNAGTLVINPVNTLTNGVYKLIQYAGSEGGSLGNLTLSGGQAGKIFALSDATSGEIDLTVSSASSDNLTWVGDGSANYWDTATGNWYDNTLSLSGANFSAGDMVTFDDTGSASPNVNIETGAVSPAAVIVTNTVNTYIFNGSKITGGGTTLTKSGSGTLILANVGNDYGGATVINGGLLQVGDGSTGSTTIGLGNVTNNSELLFNQPDNSSVVGVIVGTGRLYQLGANSTATLTLLANNTYSGLTTVDTGILQIGNGGLSGSLGANAVVVTNGGQLVIDLAGSVSLANGISGPGALSIAGPGTITLGGANSYQNNTTITNGVVKLGADNAIPSGGITTGWLILDGGATAGTLDLNGHNQAVNTLSGLSGTVLGQIVNNGGSGINTLTIGTTLANVNYHGLIEDNNNAGSGKVGLHVVGDATLTYSLTLSGLNSYSGPVLIDGGAVILGGTLATVGDAAIGTGAITLTNNGSLQMNGLGAQTPTTTFANSILVPAGTTGNLLTGGRTVYSSSITAHGTLNLTTSYVRSEPTGDWSASDGQINIIAGTGGGDVYLANAGNINWGTASVNLGTGVNVYNSANTGTGGNTFTIGALTGTGTISDDTGSGGTNRITTLIVGGRNSDFTFSGTIKNNLRQTAVNKVGSGIWTMSGNNTYTASTIISSGSIVLGTTSSFMSNCTNIVVAAGALFDVSIYNGLTFSAGQTLAGSGVVTGAVELADSDILTPGSSTVAGTLSFSNNLTLGSGTGSYAVTNNFALSSDPTGVSKTNSLVTVAGDLTLTGTNVVVINPLNTILGAGKYTLFNYSGTLYTNGVAAGNDYLPNSLVAGGAFAANSDVTLTFSNATGAVVMIVTPNGQNLVWQGGITGTVTNNWDVNISSNWFNTVASAVTNFLQYDNVTFDNTATNFNAIVAGTVAPGAITVNSTNAYTFSGTGKITGTTGLTKSGTNVLTVSNSGGNDYTGTVTINGGVFKAGSATALGATNGATYITNTGALDIGGQNLGAELVTVSGSGSGSGAILNSGGNALNALQYVTLAGDTTFGGTNRWDIRTNTFGGFLQGNGHNLTKTGANDTYLVDVGSANLGNVQIQQGRIGLQNNTALGSSGTLTLFAGAGLDLYDTTVTNTKSITLTNATISSTSSTNVLGATIALNGTGTFTATTALQLTGALGGSGGLLKNGASPLTLVVGSTYTGNTTISNGVLALVGTASIANSANVDVTAGALLDVSGLSGSLITLGSGQTLKGAGSVKGSVTVPTGSTIAPGESAAGTLTVSNNVTLGGTNVAVVNSTGTSSKLVVVTGTLNYNGGTLVINNAGPAFAVGNSFPLFSAGTYSGSFATISPSTPGAGLAWNTSALVTNGTLSVVVGGPTSPGPLTNSVSGNTLTLSWQPGLNWYLQAQTNAITTGYSNNWVTVPGSSSLSSVNITIDPSQPTVFYRLSSVP
jgi:autotransporter-associated beta strand protein